jgi:hypothetical protein
MSCRNNQQRGRDCGKPSNDEYWRNKFSKYKKKFEKLSNEIKQSKNDSTACNSYHPRMGKPCFASKSWSGSSTSECEPYKPCQPCQPCQSDSESSISDCKSYKPPVCKPCQPPMCKSLPPLESNSGSLTSDRYDSDYYSKYKSCRFSETSSDPIVFHKSVPNVTTQPTSTASTTTNIAVGTLSNANSATIYGTTLTLQPANATFPGIITTGPQTFSGLRTFGSGDAGGSGYIQSAVTHNRINGASGESVYTYSGEDSKVVTAELKKSETVNQPNISGESELLLQCTAKGGLVPLGACSCAACETRRTLSDTAFGSALQDYDTDIVIEI